MKKKLTNIEVILIIGFIIKILGLIYKILLTRILTIEGMRIMSLIFPTLSLVLCISSLSISTVVNQNIAAKLNSSKTIIKSAFNITFISSSITSIILLFSFPIYKIIYQTSFVYYPLLICIPLIYLSNTSGLLKGYLEANNNFKVTYISNFFEQISKFFMTFFLLLIFNKQSLEFKIILCFLALMLSEVISFIYILSKVKRKRKFRTINVPTNGYEKNILKQAMPLTFEQLIMTITGYLEPLLFYYSIGKTGVDLYSATLYYTKVTSYAIPLLIFAHFGVVSIAKFTFPKITKNINNETNLKAILNKSFFLCIIIATFNLVISSFYAKETLYLMYKDSSAYAIVQGLAIFYFVFYFNPIFVVTLQSFKKEKRLLATSIITSIVTLSLIAILTYFYSFSGFLYSIIIGNLLRFVLLFIQTQNLIHFRPNYKKAIPLLLILIGYYLLNFYFRSLSLLILSTLICGLLAFLLYLYFFGNKTKCSYAMKHK
ncbi:MAG: oligosaccharide flippase family protein [Anaeroplasmataceae bacterium]|nr:oligosaccharide flippase family protein [Anaeroplasmataceae bacterium]